MPIPPVYEAEKVVDGIVRLASELQDESLSEPRGNSRRFSINWRQVSPRH
jgi:hypothetical protein